MGANWVRLCAVFDRLVACDVRRRAEETESLFSLSADAAVIHHFLRLRTVWRRPLQLKNELAATENRNRTVF